MPRQAAEDRIRDESVAHRARLCRDALQSALREDPDVYGLRPVMTATGEALLAALEDLEDPDRGVGPEPRDWPGSHADWFLCGFVSRVAGQGATIADAVARRTATVCAEKILADHEIRAALEHDQPGSGLSGELLCEIYRLFFADFVAEFIRAVIAEKVNLMVPELVLADPSGQIADWIAEQIMSVVRTPCEKLGKREDDPRSLVDLARDMLKENVARALSLDEAGER